MLKNPKKADLDKDGKLSGYEKKRAKAIESNMKQKPIKAALGIATMGLLGAKLLSDKKKKKAAKIVSPVAMLDDVTKEEKNQVTTGQQKARKGKMMKARVGKSIESSGSKSHKQKLAKQNLRKEKLKELRAKKVGPVEEARIMGNMKYMGGEAKGYGAARTQGDGLSDENLIPGKSLDYYKDIM
jgi:hypothetical protein